jgi:hypothetical protein
MMSTVPQEREIERSRRHTDARFPVFLFQALRYSTSALSFLS